MTEDEMVGWHHQLNGYGFEPILGDGEGQGSLACCSPWGRRVGYNLATQQQQQRMPGGRACSTTSLPVYECLLSIFCVQSLLCSDSPWGTLENETHKTRSSYS